MAQVMNKERAPLALVAGEDYYLERGFLVFTARYHLRRGYCCGSGCRHCPYDERARREPEAALNEARDES